jgi:hypothetical protein
MGKQKHTDLRDYGKDYFMRERKGIKTKTVLEQALIDKAIELREVAIIETNSIINDFPNDANPVNVLGKVIGRVFSDKNRLMSLQTELYTLADAVVQERKDLEG